MKLKHIIAIGILGVCIQSNAQTNPIKLTRAILTVELLSENGEIGTYCPTLNDCQCQFDWIASDGIARRAFHDPTTVSANHISCLHIPLAKFFDVRVFIKAGGMTSDPLRVSL